MSYVASGGAEADDPRVGFLDEINAPVTSSARCTIARIMSTLNDQEAATLKQAAGLGSSIPATELARRLTKLGYQISSSSVLRHRKGECQCPKVTGFWE